MSSEDMTALQISSAIKFRPHPSPVLLVYAIKYEAPLAHSNVAAVAWEVPGLAVMGFSSHPMGYMRSPA
jgi:hypothetical protein